MVVSSRGVSGFSDYKYVAQRKILEHGVRTNIEYTLYFSLCLAYVLFYSTVC